MVWVLFALNYHMQYKTRRINLGKNVHFIHFPCYINVCIGHAIENRYTRKLHLMRGIHANRILAATFKGETNSRLSLARCSNKFVRHESCEWFSTQHELSTHFALRCLWFNMRRRNNALCSKSTRAFKCFKTSTRNKRLRNVILVAWILANVRSMAIQIECWKLFWWFNCNVEQSK